MAKKCRIAGFLAVFAFCAVSAPSEDTAPAFSSIPSQIGGISVPQSEYVQKQIEKYIEQFSKPFGKQQLYNILDDGEAYRLYVRRELKKRAMPAALEYLPVVESEYNPLAVSRSGARGLWQFMDNSIKGLLRKTPYIDERFDPWKSTDAALTKLQENYRQFKDWPLAIAAYNCGAGAMKKILSKSKQKTFWYIAENSLLRDQSVQYVPKLLAIALLAENGSAYGLELPEITVSTRYAEFDYVTTAEEISLARLSSELKMEPSILQKLNPSLLKNATPPDEKYELRLPSGMKQSALIALAQITARSEGTVHTVQKGETLWSISRKYGISVKELRDKNGLAEDEPLKTGKKLYIK